MPAKKKTAKRRWRMMRATETRQRGDQFQGYPGDTWADTTYAGRKMTPGLVGHYRTRRPLPKGFRK